MARFREVALQRRQQCTSVLDLGALRRQRQSRHCAELELLFDQLDLL